MDDNATSLRPRLPPNQWSHWISIGTIGKDMEMNQIPASSSLFYPFHHHLSETNRQNGKSKGQTSKFVIFGVLASPVGRKLTLRIPFIICHSWKYNV